MTYDDWDSVRLDDSIDSVLRRRGHAIAGVGDDEQTLVGTRPPVRTYEPVLDDFRERYGRASFRRLAARLLRGRGEIVSYPDLARAAGHADGALARGDAELLGLFGVADLGDEGAKLARPIDNVGPTLEWYVADLCERELRGSAAWGVKLEDLRVGGDFDVLAWLEPALVYVEVKTARPGDVSEGEIRNFLQRDAELAPDLSMLLVDTTDRLDPLVDRVNDIMNPLVRLSSGISDPGWRADPPLIRAQPDHHNIIYGWRRVYIVNAKPTILTAMRRCLRHYHERVRGRAFWSGHPINFVTGAVND